MRACVSLFSAMRIAFPAIAAISTICPIPTSVRAQEGETSVGTTEEHVDEPVVVVTGSRLRRVEQEGPAPVITITAEDIANRGYNTVLETIDALPQNSGGGFDQQFISGFTPSASAVDLRGFGIGRSLVLIDGRRVPVFPLAASGTDNFVDLSSIPLAAIEKIEVLTSGASAIYGSDAISGVVNVILKKSADDELTLRQSDTSGSGGEQSRLQFSTGFEAAGSSTLSFFGEYFKQDHMMFSDRNYSRSDVLRNPDGSVRAGAHSQWGYAGTFVDANDTLTPAPLCPTTGGSPGVDEDDICLFNRAYYRELLPDMENFSLTGRFDKPVTESLDLFARATYFNSNVVTQTEPVAADSAIIPGTNPNNPTGADGFWVRRTLEFGARREDTDNETYNVVSGLRGKLGSSFNWEAAAQYAEQRILTIGTGYYRTSGLAEAVTTGLFDTDNDGTPDPINLFDPIPQAVIDSIGIKPYKKGVSSVTSVDFELSGELFSLPNGPAQFALATEYAKQQFEDRRDAQVLAGNVESLGGSSGSGDRKYSALGVELGLPLLENLTLSLAGRYDHYDDATQVGGAFSPRLALQYRPSTTLLLRASAGQSFRAPDLQRVFGAESAGFAELIDTPQCIADGGAGRGDEDVDSCVDVVESVGVRTGANLELEEETGDNVNFGLVWESPSGFSLSTDFWYIKLEKIVNSFAPQFILDRNAESGAFADFIERDTSSCIETSNPGCLGTVISQAANLSFKRARGVDSMLGYRLSTEQLGRFEFQLGSSYVDRLEVQEAALEPVIDVLKNGTLDEFVRFRGNASLGWSKGPWGGTLFLNYIGPFAPEDTTSIDKVGSFTTVNVSGSYELPWNASIQAGVNNILNRDPPLDLSDGVGAQPFYNQDFHDPLGASGWLRYTQRF